jgi:hypothetical protein
MSECVCVRLCDATLLSLSSSPPLHVVDEVGIGASSERSVGTMSRVVHGRPAQQHCGVVMMIGC